MSECKRTTLRRRGDPELSEVVECDRAPRLENERLIDETYWGGGIKVKRLKLRISSKASSWSSGVGTDLVEGLSIWRVRGHLRRGDFQLVSQNFSPRFVSFGKVPLKRALETNESGDISDKVEESGERAGDTGQLSGVSRR